MRGIGPLIRSVVLATLTVSGLRAQALGTLRGRVLNDLTDAPVAGAEISIEEFGLRAVADSAGRFVLQRVPQGRRLVWARKIGFNPVSDVVVLPDSQAVEHDFVLFQTVTRLSAVEVVGAAPVKGKLQEFDERRRSGIGHFLTDSIISKNESRRMSEIFALIPGAHVLRGTTNAAWVASSRGATSMRPQALTEMDRRRGAKVGACYASVVLDGVFVYQGNPDESLWDINSMQPSSIAGIEVYSDGATIPAKYNGTRLSCGLVVIWTK